jgi:transposase
MGLRVEGQAQTADPGEKRLEATGTDGERAAGSGLAEGGTGAGAALDSVAASGNGEASAGTVNAVATPVTRGERAQLNEKQVAVLEKLAIGMSITDTARLVQVSRYTIYRWLNHNPVVRTAYNRWKRACEQSAESRLVAMQDTAIDIVLEALEVKRDGWLAMMLLRTLGVLKPASMRATNVEWAKQEIEAERLLAEGNLARFVEEARGREGARGGGGCEDVKRET